MKRPKITWDMIAWLLVFWVAFIWYVIGMQEANKSNQCTPTQSHQKVMATLSGIQQSLEMQISELPLSVECNK